MFHVALWEPEIPPNTGNIARLCAAMGATLHLIGRLGFRLDDRSLRRAGVDCWDQVTWQRHATLDEFLAFLATPEGECREPSGSKGRFFCFSARATVPYTAAAYRAGDCLLFGGESHGLPQEFLDRHAERTLTIPMPAGKVRSLNLATAVGIVLYEALRQEGPHPGG